MQLKKILIVLTLIFTFSLAGCNNGGGEINQPTVCSHNYTASIVDPTCTTQGYTLHTCSMCGDKYKDTYTDATGHNYVEGERNYSCSKCGKSECDGFTFKTATYNGESCYVVTNATTAVLQNGVLEMSNVNMDKEMTDLINTQRNYQFNARAVTLADQMLGLINGVR